MEESTASPRLSEEDISYEACKHRLLHIPRRFVPCLFPNCKKPISTRVFLNHFCTEHRHVPRVSISTQSPVTVTLNPSKWMHGEQRALALFEYSGRDGSLKFSPVATMLSAPNTITNAFRSDDIKSHEHVLPILLMGCRTSVSALSEPRKSEKTKRDKSFDMFVIWLVTNYTSRNVYASLKLCVNPEKILAEREFLLRTADTPNVVDHVVLSSSRFLRLFQWQYSESSP